jgi:hypothetical protein
MVYVEISRWKPVGGRYNISDTNQDIKSTLDKLEGFGIDVPVVVGLKTSFVKTKKFTDGNFISLDRYVEREVGKIAPKTFFKFSESDKDKMDTLAGFAKSEELDEFTEMVEGNKNDELAAFCRKVKVALDEMTEDDSLQNWMDDFFDKYEMLTILHDWELSRNKHQIARYIGATIKSEKD